MTNETMTARERFNAAVALEVVDRPPVFPLIWAAAPRLYGITQAAAWADHNVARDAIIRCFKDYGYDYGWHPNFHIPMVPGKFCQAPIRQLIPGRHIGEDDLRQIDERVLFSREDYDKIAALGWNGFWNEHYEKISGKTMAQLSQKQRIISRQYLEDMQICADNGMPCLIGAFVDSSIMAFSMSRTLMEFTRDLYEVPEKVEAAMEASCDDFIANAIESCKIHDNMLAFIILERGSGFYYRPEIFERFEWPFLQRYVDAFLAEGITPWMHFDTDWSINLPYLTQLPKGKCVCDLDSTTDIFRAKEILKGHMCISGDVPASLLALGKAEQVEEYCRRLIDEVGEGGGFMLTSGCECPVDVKPENLRAMVETGKRYQGNKARVKVQRVQEVKPEEAKKVTPKGEIG
jgi:hypothetical protein